MIKIDFLKEQAKYPANDIGIAKLFIDSFSDRLIFCADTGVWYFWNDRFWEKDTKDGGKRHEMLKQLAVVVNKELFKIDDAEKLRAYQKIYSKLYSKNYRDTILRDAMSVSPITSSVFDKQKFLFNCQNGTYNFLTGEFREHKKEDYLTDMSTVVYDKNADCPRFKQYLQEVMKGDQSKIDYLMTIASYCLTGDTSQECFFILYGETTRNGKGTFVETLLSLAGTYAQTVMPSTITRKNQNSGGNNSTPDLADLKSARIASVGEIEAGMLLDIALVKRMTGGNQIKARFLYENNFSYVPQFKLLIDTNFLPKMTDDSIFKSDRIHLIEFTRHFDLHERDMNLKSKLQNEKSGIFNLITEYYKLFQKQGFVMPQETIDTINKYQLDSNNVLAFTKTIYPDETSYETQKDLYDAYVKWCNEEKLLPLAKKNFKNEIAKYGAIFIPDKRRFTNNLGLRENTFWVKGFSLTEPKKSVNTSSLIPIDDEDLPF